MRPPGIVLAVFAVLIALGGCSGSQHTTGQFRFSSATTVGSLIPIADRMQAETFTGPLLSGGTYSLSEDLGKVIVVNFWATWCAPCVAESPQFDAVYRQYRSRPVTFVGIDTKDVKPKAALFVAQYSISYPIVLDEQGRTSIALGNIPAPGLPFTVIIDRQGRVAAVYFGALTAADLTPVLDQLDDGH